MHVKSLVTASPNIILQRSICIITRKKINFKWKKVAGNNEGHYVLIKVSVNQEDIAIINIYDSNNTAPKYMKQKWKDLKGGKDSFTLVVGDFNNLLSVMERTTRKDRQETRGLEQCCMPVIPNRHIQ